jgi:hypothetical protein
MSIAQPDLKLLFAESGGVCAFPNCGRRIVEPATQADEAVLIAHVAHIVADSPDGPRGDSPLTPQERNRHHNLLVLCTEHHAIVDKQLNTYSVAVLRQMKLDHQLRMRPVAGRQQPLPLPKLVSEVVFSTLLPVRTLPGVVFAAPCGLHDGQDDEVRLGLKYPQNRWEVVPFLLKEKTIFAFHNLSDPGSPFRGVIDCSNATSIPTTEFWSSTEGQRRFVTLLNRSLYKYTSRLAIRFDPAHRRFYFPAAKLGKPRRVRYRTGTNRYQARNAVWQPITKVTGEAKKYWLHLAAALRFHRVAPQQWCLSIRPERHLTRDGEIPLDSKQIGKRVTRLKARMFNEAYLGEVHFWRDYLCRGGRRRITLNFGSQFATIDWQFLEFSVTSPGVPGDFKRFVNEPAADDLFSLFDPDWDSDPLSDSGAGDEDDDDRDTE